MSESQKTFEMQRRKSIFKPRRRWSYKPVTDSLPKTNLPQSTFHEQNTDFFSSDKIFSQTPPQINSFKTKTNRSDFNKTRPSLSLNRDYCDEDTSSSNASDFLNKYSHLGTKPQWLCRRVGNQAITDL